jgi:hypothetical protein
MAQVGQDMCSTPQREEDASFSKQYRHLTLIPNDDENDPPPDHIE